ncbi:acyl-CoA dehydrogenase-like protein [Thermochaetoides thermophila DSM 1495]|uniref:Short/branched chain specific acyl-CoA dehydrogenase, mitochondrial n=1 Tax=Chaetomium thermophilum (strain DSM 1495 / CBS 144.50 / IMI 039719) TaxID=759272 RepID=G0S7P9_CHATD|nr:acyl-CoA dehydrogenase-like protein [Thermochaetoides thermophila DSM 1495]EGS21840.1 acyl-CoA dehydrogenase-like protein [Thermochaetoides thermophila DSM 1495]
MRSFARALRPAVRRSQAVSAPRLRSGTAFSAVQTTRPLSTTAVRRDISDLIPTPITHLSEVESAMADSVRKFANEVILPKVRDMDEAEQMDPAIVEQLFEQGLMSVEIPEEYGGAGMNFTAAIVGIEELARVDPSVSVMVDVHNTLVNTAVLKWGSEALKKKYLPRLATKTVGSFCLSEPVSGSDAFALATRAVETEHGYKINGSKMWITNSMEAEFFIVFANLDPSKGYKGITAFIVDKGMKGFSIAKKEKKLGIKASSTCVLNFDDVEVPKENLLGEKGQGYKYAISLLNEGRIGIGAQMTGLALGAFENAVKYVWNDRKQFGQLVGEFQGMQHQIAQAYTEICAARALVYNAARKKEAGEEFVKDAAMAKLYSSQVAGRVASLAVEWMGGMGFVREGLAEKFFRDSKIGAIYEGTSNIQLNTIAKILQKEYTQ